MTNETVKKMVEEKSPEYLKYIEDFSIPNHSKKCKKCNGIGRIGYVYDAKTKKRGEALICPKYLIEIDTAIRKHISIKQSQNIVTQNAPQSFEELIIQN